MHAGINLDVDRIVLYAPAACLGDEAAEEVDGVDLRLQMAVEDGVEVVDRGVEDYDGHGDACLAQIHAFVVDGYCQIACALALEGLCEFVGAGTVA